MRKALIWLGLVGFVATGCGSGPSPLATVRSAASKTGAVTTAHVALTIKAERGLLAAGTTYTGGFDFVARRARLQFDPSALGIKAFTGDIDALFDYAAGPTAYIHLPQLASFTQGKSWVKVNVGASLGKATGVNISSLFESNDPASGLRMLAGATEVTKVGTEVLRGAKTTHYQVVIDVDRAAAQAPPAQQDAMRQLASLYIVKTLSLEAWLDRADRVRKAVLVEDPANLRLPAQSAQAASQSGRLTITTELFDFGVPVDVSLPPADQVIDQSQLPGATAPSSATP